MTYVSEVSTLKMSINLIKIGSRTGFNSSTWSPVNITGLESGSPFYNPFEDEISVSASSDNISLPPGKYYLDGRVTCDHYSARNYYAECMFYDYTNSTLIGFKGREWMPLDYNRSPNMSEHARAYISVETTTKIQLMARANYSSVDTGKTSVKMSNARILIYRLE